MLLTNNCNILVVYSKHVIIISTKKHIFIFLIKKKYSTNKKITNPQTQFLLKNNLNHKKYSILLIYLIHMMKWL